MTQKNRPTKKIPERHCLGCNLPFPKKELLRVVRSPEGEISVDFTGKKSGRGAYLCFSSSCFKKARKAGRIARALNTEIGTVHELLAVDVSVDWAKSRELAEKQEKARELNARLKALLEGIEYLTMNRELMQLKTRVHDELGQSLLLSKRYLAQPGSVDGKAVKDAWLSGLRLLENSQPESWQAPYFVQKKQAETLGLQLEIEGSLPLEESLIPVVETALSVHLTNVLRHAGGHTAKVCCVRKDGRYRLSLTNDGKPPAGTIREGGGLSNLRSLAETQGGRMEVSSSPAFRLTIWLPAGTKEDL